MQNQTFSLEANSRPKSNGKYALMLRVTHDRSHKRIKLGFDIDKQYWKKRKNARGHYLSRSCPQYDIIQSTIENVKNEVHKRTINDGGSTHGEELREILKNNDDKSFFVFADRLMKRLRDSDQVATHTRYKVTTKKLRAYLGGEDISFHQLTVSFINDFIAYLKAKGNSITTIYDSNLKTIKAIYNQAIREDIVGYEKNPFLKIRMIHETKLKTKLTLQELQALKALDLKEYSDLWHARNYFLFSFYAAGMRFRDLCQIKWENIKNERMEYKTSKNRKPISIKLLPPMNEILSLYRKKIQPKDFCFPLLSSEVDHFDASRLYTRISSKNTTVNRQLKTLARMANIDRKVSFHIARHSFSNILRQQTNDVHAIKSLLGHSSIRQTETYLASIDDEGQDKAHESILNTI